MELLFWVNFVVWGCGVELLFLVNVVWGWLVEMASACSNYDNNVYILHPFWTVHYRLKINQGNDNKPTYIM